MDNAKTYTISCQPEQYLNIVICSNFTQEGGELYYSDMYASEVIPDHMRQDPVLWGKTQHCCK